MKNGEQTHKVYFTLLTDRVELLICIFPMPRGKNAKTFTHNAAKLQSQNRLHLVSHVFRGIFPR